MPLADQTGPPRPRSSVPTRPDARRRGGAYPEPRDISDGPSDYTDKGLASHRRRQALIEEVQEEIRCRQDERESSTRQAREEAEAEQDDYYARGREETMERLRQSEQPARDQRTGRFTGGR